MRRDQGAFVRLIVFLRTTVVTTMCACTVWGCGEQQRDQPQDTPPPPPTQAARNPAIRAISVVHQSGARPRFSPGGDLIVFDRINADGFYDVYVSQPNGGNLQPITEGRPINQRHNGNAIFHPASEYIVFISEEPNHFGLAIPSLGDPGVGLYSNLWATNRQGSTFWKLTNIPIKQRLEDGLPSMAVVNPVFTLDGSFLVWTERYAEGRDSWGRWRLKAAQFAVVNGVPTLSNEVVLLTPTQGNYVTAMGFLDARRLVVAGNLDGQHEYGMDQYVFDMTTRTFTNLTRTPELWEEDSSIAPNGRIAYMSNVDSPFRLDFSNPTWATQPRTREYYLMNADGGGVERLTYFNDPSAPEYAGRRAIAAASDFSPDGRYLIGTVGVDRNTGDSTDFALRVILIEFASPMTPGGATTSAAPTQPGTVTDASDLAPLSAPASLREIRLANWGDTLAPAGAIVDKMLVAGQLDVVRGRRDGNESGTYERLQQFYNGVPVFGGIVARQYDRTRTRSVFGRVFDGITVATNPKITAADAGGRATRVVPGSTVTGEIVIGVLPQGDIANLAYVVPIRSSSVTANIFVSADDGRVLSRHDCSVFAPADIRPASRVSARASTVSVGSFDGSLRRLNEYLATGRLLESDVMSRETAQSDPFAAQAASHHMQAILYFHERFGRRSIDDAWGPVVPVVHTLSARDASLVDPSVREILLRGALHAGGGVFLYGDEPSDRFGGVPPVASQDAVAREVARAVLAFDSALGCQDEARELAEGFVEVMAVGSARWRRPGFAWPERQLMESGAISEAFHLAIAGGRHPRTNLSVRGIGLSAAERVERVFYRAFMRYAGPRSDFRDARSATVYAASELFGTNAAETTAVIQAWDAVGIQ